jgi:hypothetical protein
LAQASNNGVFSLIICAATKPKNALKKGQSRPPCRSNLIPNIAYVDREGGDKSAFFENCVVGLIGALAQNQNTPVEIEFSEKP